MLFTPTRATRCNAIMIAVRRKVRVRSMWISRDLSWIHNEGFERRNSQGKLANQGRVCNYLATLVNSHDYYPQVAEIKASELP